MNWFPPPLLGLLCWWHCPINQLISETHIGRSVSALPCKSPCSDSQITWVLKTKPLIKKIQGLSKIVADSLAAKSLTVFWQGQTPAPYPGIYHCCTSITMWKLENETQPATMRYASDWYRWENRSEKSRKDLLSILYKNGFLSLITRWKPPSREERLSHYQWSSRWWWYPDGFFFIENSGRV